MSVSLSSDSSRSTAPPSQEDSPIPKTGHRDGGRHGPTPSVTPGGAAPDHHFDEEENRNDDHHNNNDSSSRHHNDEESQSQQQQQQEVDDDEEEWLMACRCESGRTLMALLSCLQHVAESPADQGWSNTSSVTAATTMTATQASTRRQRRRGNTIQPVTVFCTPAGFTFHVFGPAKQSEASIELQKSMFSQFQVVQSQDKDNDDRPREDWQAGGEFCVNLMSVLDALQLLGPLVDKTTIGTSGISVGMSYNLRNEIFKVELLQNEVLCTVAIPGLMAPADDPEGDSISNAFRSSPVAARMMVKSGILRELLPEWSSVAGSSCASVAVSARRGFELAVLGHYGECWVQVPARGDHLVSPLELANDKKTVARTYPLHSLLSSMKGLEIAEETCININSEGIMAIQHKTVDPTGQGKSNFVDFILTCLEEDEDDDDQDDDEENNDDETTRADEASTPSSQLRRRLSQSQDSPGMATIGSLSRQRRRRQQQLRESPASRRDGSTAEVQDSSGSETEGEAESPSQRQKRQAMEKRKKQQQQQQEEDESSVALSGPNNNNNNNNEDDNEDDGETPPAISAASLFGTVVRHANEAANTSENESPRRRQRRQRRSASRPPRQAKRKKKSAAKQQSDSDSGNDQSDEENQMATPPRGAPNRDGDCSSPELVYGEQ